MATYIMFGKYSSEAVKGISTGRTEKAVGEIKKLGGTINAIYALLGVYDLVLIVDFPGIDQVMKASLALTRLTGIGFSSAPAVTVENFDKIASEA